MIGQHRFNPWIFAGDLVVANMQIGAVLWHRLAAPQTSVERARMISEKVAAASSGVFETQKAALRLSRDISLGKVSATRMACAPAELGAAASKPALKTVKANAKRLGKRSAKKVK
ncbi:hypothetical protein [Pseudorhodoplanes sp.]|uniref:hypothetical protein n=1 Tax=Pseudorhodoplanes sp. TaxID=1934341 RepID=UPI002BE47DF1|nr:hypothetical protein [Pseudorhodoplanes sp.]HWV52661.1 hypothetical protein [Pseudorhodoplanes sp.]